MQEERRKLEDAIKKLHLQIAQKDSVIKKLTQSEVCGIIISSFFVVSIYFGIFYTDCFCLFLK
jgi:hypothetical protein